MRGSNSRTSDSKYHKLLEMLGSDTGRGLIGIHLDPRHDGVIVPSHLKRQPSLKLNVAYGFNLPNFEIDADDGVYATLSFDRLPFGCVLPWDAIFALTYVDDVGFSWPRSIPDDVNASQREEPIQNGWKPRLIKGGKAE